MGRRKKASNGGGLIGLTIALMVSLAIGYWNLLNRIIGWLPWFREKEEVNKNLIAAFVTIALIWLTLEFGINQPKEIAVEPSPATIVEIESTPPKEIIVEPSPINEVESSPHKEIVIEPPTSPIVETESTPDYSRRVTCGDFSRQSEAYPYIPSNPRLDRDRDGIPCESLPP